MRHYFLGLALAACLGTTHGQTLSGLLNGGGGSACPAGMSCAPSSTPPAGPASCGPGLAGAPCGGAGPASQGSGSPLNLGVGNPINLITGNKYQREVDLPALPGVLGLEIVRHYNSTFSGHTIPNGILGRGWKLSYETDLYAIGRTVQIVQADGTRIIFSRDPRDPSQCASANPAHGKVQIHKTARGDEYTWTWTNGRQLSFDSGGKLVQILAPTGEFVSLQHDMQGHLVKVTDPQGRSLQLTYLDRQTARKGDRFRGVQAIDSPVGRFTYEYGSELPKGAAIDKIHVLANLVKMTYPKDGNHSVSRLYHYEDARFPTLLTGITVDGAGSDGKAMRQRIVTWAYDLNGKAILSVKGEPRKMDQAGQIVPGTGIEQVTLDRSQPGQVIVTNSLGQATVYRHGIIGGEFRLLEVRGPGCTSCGRTNVRYGYDRLGRLTDETALDAAGQPLQTTRTELDRDGRSVRISTIAWRNGKPQVPQWRVRYEYAAFDTKAAQVNPALLPGRDPVLLARPSVVPGKEHRIRITYNDHGQPTQITESGWSPATEGKNEATPIERTTTYRYQSVNGRSVLVEIDGPLKNGPKNSPEDSDITRYTWNTRGDRLQSVIEPGNIVHRFEYDHVSLGDGVRLRATVQWGDIVQRRWRTVDFVGNALARGQEVLDLSGTVLASHREQIRYNAKGQLSEIVLGDQHRSSIAYQPNGIPQDIRLPDGRILRFFHPAATAASTVEQSGLQTRLGPEGSAAATQVLQFQTDDKVAQRLIDDFGRTVAIQNPSQGWRTARYDEADRIVVTIDPRGARQRASYNAAGQLVKVERFASGQEKAEQTLTLTWHGPYKREETVLDAQGKVQHRNRYDYTEWGQVKTQTAEIARENGTPILLRQQMRYDNDGLLVSKTLGTGERIAYRYYASSDGRHPLAQIELIRWPAWLDWLVMRLPERWQRKTILAYVAPPTLNRSQPQRIEDETPVSSAPHAEPGLSTTAPGEHFDSAGFPHEIATAAGHYVLSWNAAGQLVLVQDASSGKDVARYAYDAQGRRSVKITPHASEYYLYEGTQLVSVLRTAQGLASRDGQEPQAQRADEHSHYLYYGHRVLAWINSGKGYNIRTDERGAVTAVLEPASSTAKTLWDSQLNAWGASESKQGSSPFDPKLRLVNQYADEETGLYYNIARYYDPQRGRYVSPDPAGIVDSIDGDTPAALKLDITVYASGQPSRFFDPDGAAKLVYYAITTGANGAALGNMQGFTKARWAFTIQDIQADGSDGTAAIDQRMQEYASAGKGLLFDMGGNFLTAGTSSTTWSGSSNAIVDLFKEHYGNNLISVSQFTIDNMSNRDATLLIAKLTNTTAGLGTCPAANLLLPQIMFAAEDAAINVTQANANGANRQRILNCTQNQSSTMPVQFANDTERNRVEKYEAAAEMNETSWLGKDCSQNGCPGVAITGQTGYVYHASYGRSQFTGVTFLETIKRLSTAEKQALGVTADMQTRIDGGLRRAIQIGERRTGAFEKYRKNYTCSDAATAWDRAGQAVQPLQPAPLSLAELNTFQANTGLGRQAFIDMICFTPQGNARPIGEGKNAFMTEAILNDTTLKNWMMGIFRSDDRFGYLSRILIRNNLRTVLGAAALSSNFNNTLAPTLPNGTPNPAYAQKQRSIEEGMAMRVARLHNGGQRVALSIDTSVLTRSCVSNGPNRNMPFCDTGNYVNKFIGIINDGHGDWRSLRCAINPQTILGTPGTWRGLELRPLNLPN